MREETVEPYKKLRSFNLFSSSIGGLLLIMLNLILWIGTEEDFNQLQEEMPQSFLYRFAGFGILGLIGVALLTAINLISNYTWLKNKEKIDILKIGLIDLGIVALSCLIGTWMFFLK